MEKTIDPSETRVTDPSEPQVTDIIVGNRGTDVPDSGTEPSSSGSSTTSKLQRYYKKFSQLDAGKEYKFFNRDNWVTSQINYLPFNSYVGTVKSFDINLPDENPFIEYGENLFKKVDVNPENTYKQNTVFTHSGVNGNYFIGHIISGNKAKTWFKNDDIIIDDDIYVYGYYYPGDLVDNPLQKVKTLLFRVYGIRPLISQIYSAITDVLTRKKTGGKRKRRTHRRRRSNRRRRS